MTDLSHVGPDGAARMVDVSAKVETERTLLSLLMSRKDLGKIRVVETWPDKAVCEVVNKTKNGIIQRGDNVTTKL